MLFVTSFFNWKSVFPIFSKKYGSDNLEKISPYYQAISYCLSIKNGSAWTHVLIKWLISGVTFQANNIFTKISFFEFMILLAPSWR